MGLFGKSKKSKTLDLTGHYLRQQERLSSIKSDMAKSSTSRTTDNLSQSNSQTENSFGFLGSLASSSDRNDTSSEKSDEGYKTLVPRSESMASSFYDTRQTETRGAVSQTNLEEKRKKLTKRILDMTEKIEELSNQIYHLTQRVEALERRNYTGSGSYN
ncbi:MAG TPA: hypothetical protein PLK34_01170 [Candidatus Pacearchaeota archaeon]|nr:hypothetical protein [Candidatus Pacearchaeota archaeon]